MSYKGPGNMKNHTLLTTQEFRESLLFHLPLPVHTSSLVINMGAGEYDEEIYFLRTIAKGASTSYEAYNAAQKADVVCSFVPPFWCGGWVCVRVCVCGCGCECGSGCVWLAAKIRFRWWVGVCWGDAILTHTETEEGKRW